MKKQLLILTTLFISVIGYSQTFNAPDNNNNTLEYDITTATTVEIRDYVSGGTDIDIPSTVDNPNDGMTYNVTTIGNSAFQANNLTSVTIPVGVTNIGNLAFFQNNLTSITIPSSVTMIGSSAFVSNPLTCVISEGTNPATVFTPTPGAGSTATDSFSTNRTNVNLTIPPGTASAYATAQWTGFNSVAEGLTGTFVVENITYQINGSNEVTVTDYNTAGGTVVNIPVTVNRGCTNYSVTNIGTSAFTNNNLTSVTIPDSVINIGTAAFAQNSLTTVVIPDSVLNIGWNAFTQNLSMISLDLGNSVEAIGESAFSSTSISNIVIPDSVLTIGDTAFAYVLNVSSLVLGNNVTTIGESAFNFNPSATVTNITIPSSVTSIGELAFPIASLTDVTSLGTTPPNITTGTNDTFGSISARGNINLHIPPNTTGAYVTDAGALWTDFMSVTEDALLSTSDFELANDIKVITTQDTIKVVSSNGIILDNYVIYNISGAKITTGHQSNIPTTSLATGIYILKLDFNKGTVVKKFAK